MKPPKARPCGSCPYRKDVPGGVWHPDEYAKLIPYDRPTHEQPEKAFNCHQNDGHLCGGWVGTHDMHQSLAIKLAIAAEFLAPEDIDAVLDYESPVPLWESGMEAATHGLSQVWDPPKRAQTIIRNLKRKGVAHDGPDTGPVREGNDPGSGDAVRSGER